MLGFAQSEREWKSSHPKWRTQNDRNHSARVPPSKPPRGACPHPIPVGARHRDPCSMYPQYLPRFSRRGRRTTQLAPTKSTAFLLKGHLWSAHSARVSPSKRPRGAYPYPTPVGARHRDPCGMYPQYLPRFSRRGRRTTQLTPTKSTAFLLNGHLWSASALERRHGVSPRLVDSRQ